MKSLVEPVRTSGPQAYALSVTTPWRITLRSNSNLSRVSRRYILLRCSSYIMIGPAKRATKGHSSTSMLCRSTINEDLVASAQVRAANFRTTSWRHGGYDKEDQHHH